jgi:hypothetical protein
MSKPVVDYFLGDLLMHDHPIEVLSSAPASPVDGKVYLNSTDHKIYIYYGYSWQELHQLVYTPPAIATGQPIGLLLGLTYTI